MVFLYRIVLQNIYFRHVIYKNQCRVCIKKREAPGLSLSDSVVCQSNLMKAEKYILSSRFLFFGIFIQGILN